MTGPEHYKEAERYIEIAAGNADEGMANFNIARAGVHATLALAASQAEVYADAYTGENHNRAWSEAIS